MEKNNQSVLDSLSPTKLFVSGLVVGILVLCTIGFFIVLGILLKGDDVEGKTNNNPTVVNNGNTNNGGTQEVSLRPVDEKSDHIRGNKDADITVVTFTDFECPFCKRFHDTMLQVMQNYGDKVRWVYRQFPLDSLHRQARTEAEATECAAEQGKFWEFVDVVFENTLSNDGLDLNKMSEYAKQAGLSVNKFTECWESKKYASVVNEDVSDGQNAGAGGTPYSIIIGPDGQQVPVSGAQPYSVVESAIKSLL